jgi:hypothetical protein
MLGAAPAATRRSAGMQPESVRERKILKDENARLKSWSPR